MVIERDAARMARTGSQDTGSAVERSLDFTDYPLSLEGP